MRKIKVNDFWCWRICEYGGGIRGGICHLVNDVGATSIFPHLIASLDKVLKGRTTKTGSLGEMAGSTLCKKESKFNILLHYGYDCYHSIALLGDGGVRRLYKVSKNGNSSTGTLRTSVAGGWYRYGNKLAGWFFDGAQRYYDTHFDGSFRRCFHSEF